MLKKKKRWGEKKGRNSTKKLSNFTSLLHGLSEWNSDLKHWAFTKFVNKQENSKA